MKTFSAFLSVLLIFCTFGFAFGQLTQQVTNGQKTSPVSFPASGCSYTWVNNTPGIGLSNSGTGDIPAFTAVNNGSTPIVATILAIPSSKGGYAYMVDNFAGNVSVIDLATNAIVAIIPVGFGPIGATVSPDGSKVYISNGGDQTISVVSTATNSVIAKITGLGVEAWGMSISPDGSRLYVANNFSDFVSVIDTNTNAVIGSIQVGYSPFDTCVSPDGTILYVSDEVLNEVTVINASTFAVIKTIPVGRYPYGLTISADGTRLYVANDDDNTVSVIDTKANAVVATVAVGPSPSGLSITPDGKLLYVANLNSNMQALVNSVTVVSTATNKVVANVDIAAGAWNLNVSPDGTAVYVAMASINELSIISTANNTVIATVPAGGHPISIGNFISGCRQVTLTITILPSPPPLVVVTGSLPGLKTIYGTPSAAGQFSISGTNMKSGILVTPPKGFEVSTDNKTFGPTVTIGAAGTILPVSVYIRLASTTSVGNYSGNVVLSSTGGADVNIATAASTVSAAPLTVIANNVNKTYGQTLVNQAASTGFTATGLQNKETIGSIAITYGNGASATASPGTYLGTVIPAAATGGTFSPSNYTITFSPGDITVGSADLIITADSKTRLYNTDNPTLTITYAGFVNNQGPADLTTLPVISTTATLTSPIGDYPITVGGSTSADYSISYVQGVLAIVKVLPATMSIPNTFTPNGDGINDVWDIAALQNYPACDVSIFTRYGILVYHSVGYAKPWDGTYNGGKLPTGTYYYLILPQTGMKALAGPITIVR